MRAKAPQFFVTGVSVAMLLLVALAWPLPGRWDFLSIYTGAKLVGTPNLYSADHANRIQGEISGQSIVRGYTRPPFYAALTWPLGRLRYGTAFLVWQLLNVAALLAFVVLWRYSGIGVLISCWYLPSWWNLVAGQDMPLLLLCFAASVRLFERGSPFLAGAVLALCGAKPHLFLLIPLVLIGKRAWRFGAGLIAGAIVLFVLSGAIAGWDWPARDFEIARLVDQHEGPQGFMPGLGKAFVANLGSILPIALILAAVVGAIAYSCSQASFRYAMAVAACGSLMISIHSFIYDWMLLLPMLMTLEGRLRPGKAIALSGLMGVSALTLRSSAIALIGQFSPLALVCLAVFLAHKKESGLAGSQVKPCA